MVPELETQTVGLTLGLSQFTKRHNSVKTVNGIIVLNLRTSSDYALYIVPSFKKISQRISGLFIERMRFVY